MRETATILLILFSVTIFATEQTPDLLIYKSDSIYIYYFPLEILAKSDSIIAMRLNDTNCISTDCWRQYIGVWQIENDSLFLIGLKNCCNYKEIPLNKVFSRTKINKGKVFANWYSENINSGFGERLGFSEDNWEYIYKKKFKCSINSGQVNYLEIVEHKDNQSDSIINKESNQKFKYADSTIYILVDTFPVLITTERNYEMTELKLFILNNIRFPQTEMDCEGSVYISFIVEKDGKVSHKEFVRKLCDGYDEEAMKVIDMMTNWKPGLINGIPVRTKMTLPLRYRYE